MEMTDKNFEFLQEAFRKKYTSGLTKKLKGELIDAKKKYTIDDLYPPLKIENHTGMLNAAAMIKELEIILKHLIKNGSQKSVMESKINAKIKGITTDLKNAIKSTLSNGLSSESDSDIESDSEPGLVAGNIYTLLHVEDFHTIMSEIVPELLQLPFNQRDYLQLAKRVLK